MLKPFNPPQVLDAEDDPSPAPHIAGPARASNRAGLSLLGRENALARAASGEVRQVTQLLINPARVRLWAGNARIQERLSVEAVQDLIDSILAEGGQKVPPIWMTRQPSVSPTLRTARARMSRISSERATMLRRLKPIMAARRCAWPNA